MNFFKLFLILLFLVFSTSSFADNHGQDEIAQEISEDEEVKAPEQQSNKEEKEELTLEDKLKETEEKLLRSLAEIENQRRRFEKEIKDAFEFGSFNFAKESLAILDNLQRARDAINTLILIAFFLPCFKI